MMTQEILWLYAGIAVIFVGVRFAHAWWRFQRLFRRSAVKNPPKEE